MLLGNAKKTNRQKNLKNQDGGLIVPLFDL